MSGAPSFKAALTILLLEATPFASPVAGPGPNPPSLPSGRYRLHGLVEVCGDMLCARIDPGGRAEQLVALEPSRWDVSLRSIVGLRVTLLGRLAATRLTLEAAPRVFRDSLSEVAAPSPPFERLDAGAARR